jgi:hypothetical protein
MSASNTRLLFPLPTKMMLAAIWETIVKYLIIVQYADIALRCCRACHTNSGTIEYLPKAVLANYMTTHMIWDLIAAFPMLEIVSVFGAAHHKFAPWLRLVRLVLCWRLFKWFNEAQVLSFCFLLHLAVTKSVCVSWE